ncbi:MAG: DNA mismatch repair endonuclease MutL [Bacteroidota bacterium]
MADIIKVLPDSVANQIAAGEVIQRPASVVKELLENAVDSGADRIQVIIRDAGRTLVQVADNGCGMSEADARLSFERHATSKIRQADDLFSIRTMGFRGEALASIASVAQVELKTKTMDSSTGTRILISASEVEIQEPVSCSNGTNISVRNLFFNVPARRRFLKAQSTELKHIITEFQRIALPSYNIAFTLHHNDSEVYNLPAARQHERIQHLFGKSMAQILVNVKTETSIVKVTGYIGKPEFARKTFGEQFFFVNNRFIKHPYLHRAVTSCYDSLIQPDAIPAYFIFLDIDPSQIDVNIHPTKTEIKFEDERAIFQILQASIREALGKFNLTPTLDFDREGAMEIPYLKPGQIVVEPGIKVNPEYNPFDPQSFTGTRPPLMDTVPKQGSVTGWEQLYAGLQQKKEPAPEIVIPESRSFLQIKNKYVLLPVKSGIMVINQARAFERILYEELQRGTKEPAGTGQQILFPVTFELNPVDLNLLTGIADELAAIGFDIQPFGGNSVILSAVPASLQISNPKELIEKLLEDIKNESPDMATRIHDRLIRNVARLSARSFVRALMDEEVQALIDRLFACREPQFTPGGKAVLTILQMDELEKRLR